MKLRLLIIRFKFDSDMTKALELSLLEQQNRNEILNQEDDEFNRILEISTIEKWLFVLYEAYIVIFRVHDLCVV